MSERVSFFVAGVPIQQGSARAFLAGGKARITSDTRRDLKGWRSDIHAAADQRFSALWTGPVGVSLEFVMPRPKSLAKKYARPWHAKKPDIDKLERAALDAFTGVVYGDDAQVAQVYVTKVTAGVGEQTGVRVSLWELEETA